MFHSAPLFSGLLVLFGYSPAIQAISFTFLATNSCPLSSLYLSGFDVISAAKLDMKPIDEIVTE